MRKKTAVSRRWGASCSVIAGLLAAAPATSHAQGFAGTPTVASGAAVITGSGTTQTITLGAATQQTIINWAPTDSAFSASPINFLAAGQTVNFNAPGATFNTYSVLNRILPTDTTRAIGLNGAINSTANARVWFYSPSGFLIGSTATFNLGGLVLTASDPVQTTDPLTGAVSFVTSTSGTDTFSVTGVNGSQSGITIQSGAQINVTGVSGNSTYMVAIAPQINNAGTINVAGSTALVAAESASFSVTPSGLFNISVIPTPSAAGPATPGGTSVVANTFTSTGSVGGTDSVANGAAQVRRVYMVAIPKNNAISMAISSGGSVGFAAAGAAAMDGNEVVLSAGENIADTGTGNPTNGTAAGQGFASLTIGAGAYNSNLYAVSTGSATVTDPTSNISFLSDLTLVAPQASVNAAIGTIDIAGDLSLIADNTGLPALGVGVPNSANVAVGSGATLNVGSNADILAVYGNLTLSANDALAGQGGLAQIAVTGGTLGVNYITALSANGSWANAPGTNFGGVITNGGIAKVTASAGGTITAAQALTLNANADATGAGSNFSAAGGSTSVTVAGTGSKITTPGSITAMANATGGVDGGSAFGGTVGYYANSGGVLGTGFTGRLVGSATATGATGTTADGGFATGGSINVIANDGTVAMQGPAVIALSASAVGGQADTTNGGAARGGSVAIQTQGATGAIVSNLGASTTGGFGTTIDVSATGGSVITNGSGGTASGGTAFINVSGTGQSIALDAIPSLTITAAAQGGAGVYQPGGAATGGKIQLNINGGSFESAGVASFFSAARGGASYSSSGGSAIGGNVLVYPGLGGSLTIQGGTTFSVAAIGGTDVNGNGGNALGGNVLIDAVSPGAISLTNLSGAISVDTSSTAGNGFNGPGTTASAGGGRFRTTGSFSIASPLELVGNSSLSIQTGGDLTVTGTVIGTGAGAYLQLWADNTGTGTGTVTLASNAINLTGAGAAVDIDYNPTALGTPTDFTPGVVAGLLTAYQLVDNVNQLQLIGTYPTQNFALGKNIDASATQGWNAGAGFVPIGTLGTAFSGNFDGLGHTISNLFINATGVVGSNVGLFGLVGTGSGLGNVSIRNVGLINPQVLGDGAFVGGLIGDGDSGSGTIAVSNSYATGGMVSGGAEVGGLIGNFNGAVSLREAHSDTSVVITDTNGSIGGLIGSAGISGSVATPAISDVYATGSVTASGLSGYAIGGLIGSLNGSTLVLSQAYATGSVNLANAGSGVPNAGAGGLIGTLGGRASISAVYATGAITIGAGTTHAGGLVGLNFGIITNSWASGQVTAPAASTVGGLVGSNDGSNGTGAGSVTNSYWDTNSTQQGNAIGANTNGGTAFAVNLVSSNPADIAAGIPSAFLASSYPNLTNGNWVYDAGITRPIGAWEVPVAQYLVAPVSSAHQVQLIDQNGAGSYLVTQNIDMSGTVQLSDIWGATGLIPIIKEPPASAPDASTVFVGTLDGGGHVLSNLTINGNYNAQTGLVAENAGEIANLGLWNATIVSSNGSLSSAGLLTAANDATGIIFDSFATGSINTVDAVVGGLVGNNAGSISQSYASVAISGAMLAGGLAGSNTGTIAQVFANGAVSGGQAGGLIGSNTAAAGSVTNAYWDNQLSGQNLGCGISSSDCSGVTGLTTAQTQQAGNFTGFTIDTIGGQGLPWRMYQGSTTPLLEAFLTPITVQPGSLTQVYDATDPTVGVTTYGAGAANLFGAATLTGFSPNAGTHTITYVGGLYSNQIGYDLVTSPTPGVIAITPAALTLTAATDSRTYDGTTNSIGVVQITGLQGTDSVGNLSQSFDTPNVGSRIMSVNPGYLIADGNSGGNYTVTLQASEGTITAAPLTLTGNTANTTYNAAAQTNGYAITGGVLFGSDSVSSVSGLATGTNAGTYLDTLSGAIGTGLSNYAITYVNGSLTIGQAPLTVSGTFGNAPYNGTTQTNTGATVAGAQGSDSFIISGFGSGFNAGAYTDALAVSGNSGTLLSNYNVTINQGALTISKAPLTLTGNTTTTTYNAATQTNAYTITAGQLFASDTIASVNGLASGTNAGTYLDTLSGATGTGLANYTITYGNGSLTIGKAPLTLTGANTSTTYNATAQSNVGANLLGVQGNDSFTITGFASGTNAGIYADALGLVGNGPTLLSNYTVQTTQGQLTINKAALTLIAGIDSRTYNGTVNSIGVAQIVGLQGTDSVGNISQSFDSPNVGSRVLSVNPGYVVNDGNSGGNYAVALQSTAGTISAAPLTLTGNTTSTTYNATVQSNGYAITSGVLFGSDAVTSVNGLASGTNAGTYFDTLSGANGTGLTNYAITYVNGVLNIGKAALTLTAATDSRTYNGTVVSAGVVGISGLQGNDSVSNLGQSFDSANAGARVLAVQNGYTVNDGNSGGNYAVSLQTNTGTITQAPLTLSGDTTSTTYNAAAQTNGYAITGGTLFGSDSISSVNGLASGTNAGTYLDTLSGATGTGLANYAVTYVNGALHIGKAALTLVAATDSRTYNGTAVSAGVVGISGLQGNDSVSNLSQSFDSANAGARVLAVQNGYIVNDGNSGGNYTVSLQTNTGTITPAPLTLSGNTTNVTYNAATQTNGYAVTGGTLFGSDSISSINGLATGTNAGTYLDTLSGATGIGLSNYAIRYVNGALNIAKAALTLTAAIDTRSYNGTAVSTGVVGISGLQGNDSVSNLSQSFDSANAGARVLSVNNGYVVSDGNSGGNYAVSLQTNTGTITQAPLTLSGNTTSTTYNGAAQANAYTITAGQLFGADSIASVNGLASGTNAGTYLDSLAGATGTGLSNYAITYVNGALNIAMAPLTLTGNITNVTYNGASQSNGYAITSGQLFANDAIASVGGLATATNAGTYADHLSGAAGPGMTNYAITYANGSLAIAPAPLILSAASETRLYNATTASSGQVGVSGLLGHDTVTNLGQSFDSANAGARTLAVNSGYAIADGNNGGNYSVTLQSASGAITPAPLTVVYNANTASSIYGNAIPALSGTTSLQGLQGNDTQTSVLGGTAQFTTTASAQSNVGQYGIAGSGLSLSSSNYTASFAQQPGNATALSITARPIDVIADPITRPFGVANPALTYTVAGPGGASGLVNGDQLTGALTTSANLAAVAGKYPITQGTLAATSNYQLTYIGSDLVVSPSLTPVTITVTSVDTSLPGSSGGDGGGGSGWGGSSASGNGDDGSGNGDNSSKPALTIGARRAAAAAIRGATLPAWVPGKVFVDIAITRPGDITEPVGINGDSTRWNGGSKP